MMTVASRELKNRLGKYLRIVREGQPLQITDRGRPIACIIPLSSATGPDNELLKVLAKGNIRPGSGAPLGHRRPAVMKPGKSVTEMISEERR